MFTENRKPLDSLRSLGTSPRKRGRPPGRTAAGDATRARLFRAAIGLIGERGYDAATLRDVAKRAKVSPGLLYRYFPDKRSVVLALYDELSDAFAQHAARMPLGKWRDRFVHALELSFEVLGPHRVTLRALAPVLVGDVEDGVFAQKTAFSRERVQSAFERAVVEATDAPTPPLAHAIGRLLYLAHLGVILWWLLDRSPGRRATKALIGLFRQILPSATLALRLRPVRKFVESADALFAEALLSNR
jgi:AcrR family transcriptional regulator